MFVGGSVCWVMTPGEAGTPWPCSRVQGEGLKEAQAINKSLSALGNVIHALTLKKGGGHVP